MVVHLPFLFLTDAGFDSVMLFEEPDYADAFIGVTTDGRAVYSYARMLEHLEGQGMDADEALEFIDYNTIGSLNPDDRRMPVILFEGIDGQAL